MSTAEQNIKARMKERGFFPKKKLGQHFLTNQETVQKIIRAVGQLKPGLIMEVGPGWGALTEGLLQLKKPLAVVEADPQLAQYWREKNVFVVEGSALKVPYGRYLKAKAVLVGNLPYQIASRLLITLCPGPASLKALVLMFQKEVAQRIVSAPHSKNYGILSVLSQSFWKTHVLLSAGVSDFYPRPKVSGQVIVFQKKTHTISNPKKFLSLVKLCFSHRRKFLSSQLKTITDQKTTKDIFEELNMAPSTRAEGLTPRQFQDLFQALEKRKAVDYTK